MPFDFAHASPDDLWNEDTGETVGEALERFAGFGPQVPPEDVPGLVREGARIWSFGYGDDPEEFTTIDADDIGEWEEDFRDWEPFRIDKGSPQVRRYAPGGYSPPLPTMTPAQALAIVTSRLEAVEELGARQQTALDVLSRAVEAWPEDADGHVWQVMCPYCLNEPIDVYTGEYCPERERPDGPPKEA